MSNQIPLLGARSHFSIGESLMSPKNLVKGAAKFGYDTVALTDTMSVSGMVEFTKQAKEEGIKPIIGCRLRIVDEPLDKTPKKKRSTPNRQFFVKVYVRNADGMTDLIGLLSKAYQDDHFYYVPRLGFDELLEVMSRGNLTLSSDDLQSILLHEDYRDYMRKLRTACDSSHLFLELTPINTPLFDTLNLMAIELSAELDIPTVLSYPALYESADNAATLEVLAAITSNTKMDAPWRNQQWVQDFTFQSQADLLNKAIQAKSRTAPSSTEWKEAFTNAFVLADGCAYKWDKLEVTLPKMAADETAQLLSDIKEGWKKRLQQPTMGYMPEPSQIEDYKRRLAYEFGILKKMGFERYFLLVEDLVKWAKENEIIVGPGRGSVGGSLIAFLLGITDVDPLRFNLIFERFINPDRIDLPDADLDFMSSRRQEVVYYLIDKYGKDRVAGISNYGTLASASALRDAGRVHNMSQLELRATKFVPKEHGNPMPLDEAAQQVPELATMKAEHQDLWKHATTLEGVMRSLGQHAAGVVVAGEPIVNRAVVETRGEFSVVNWDKRVVEDWGLVKMDILGLSTLDVLSKTIRLIKENHKVDINLTELALEDPATMEAFGRGETVGIFQFESSGMRKLLKDLAAGGTLTFDDLAAATSLYRPGPMDSGLLDDYVAIKQGAKYPSYDHPNMEAALEPTASVIIYQEQVMQLAQDLAGFSMTEADHLRKAMGKKDKDKMGKMRKQWIDGCKSHSSMDTVKAGQLFDKIEKFAGYGFNRSHAVEYSIISYWTMWLKTNYPAEFYAGSLSVVGEDKLPTLVADAQAKDIYVVPPDVNNSGMDFTITYDAARAQTILMTPFGRLKGLSDKTSAAIIEAQEKKGGPFDSKEDFLAHVNKTKCNKRAQDVLERVGAFATIEAGQIDARHPDRLKEQMELMPGLVVEHIKAERTVTKDKFVMGKLAQIIADTRACEGCDLAGGVHPTPRMGRAPKLMVVSDCPNWSEEQHHKLMEGDGADYLKRAMKAAGLSIQDAYFTTLVKSPKSDKMLTMDQINACTKYLEREIELLKPPVIITLGSASTRHFLPGVKGSIVDLSGKVTYLPELDASIVVGINPNMIHFDPEKTSLLDDTMLKAANLVT